MCKIHTTAIKGYEL
uniref:Uncharacterized protein n=1 Tax=Rhizophora mucronata TaxID=61149 RepID=A0A2P2NXM8_RHIMU